MSYRNPIEREHYLAIKAAGNEFGVPMDAIAAVAAMESKLSPGNLSCPGSGQVVGLTEYPISYAGALGTMQVMPIHLASWGLNPDSWSDRYRGVVDLELNYRMGVALLWQALDYTNQRYGYPEIGLAFAVYTLGRAGFEQWESEGFQYRPGLSMAIDNIRNWRVRYSPQNDGITYCILPIPPLPSFEALFGFSPPEGFTYPAIPSVNTWVVDILRNKYAGYWNILAMFREAGYDSYNEPQIVGSWWNALEPDEFYAWGGDIEAFARYVDSNQPTIPPPRPPPVIPPLQPAAVTVVSTLTAGLGGGLITGDPVVGALTGGLTLMWNALKGRQR